MIKLYYLKNDRLKNSDALYGFHDITKKLPFNSPNAFKCQTNC